MVNVSDIKPRFKDSDLLDMVRSLYFTFCTVNPNRKDANYRAGFLAGLCAFALQVGINPATFLSENDANLLRRMQSR